MPNSVLGKIDFVKSYVDVRLGPEVRLADYECAPPPGGTISHFSPPTRVDLVLVPEFLQAAETRALIEGATPQGGTAPTTASILSHLAQAFGFTPLDIDLTRIPAHWKQVVPCFDASVRYQVEYTIWEINAKTTQAVTLDGQAYPQNDTVASFRVEQPTRYRFIRRLTQNKACCPGMPDVPPFSEVHAWIPEPIPYEWDLPPHWHWKPKFEYQWQWILPPEKKCGCEKQQ